MRFNDIKDGKVYGIDVSNIVKLGRDEQGWVGPWLTALQDEMFAEFDFVQSFLDRGYRRYSCHPLLPAEVLGWKVHKITVRDSCDRETERNMKLFHVRLYPIVADDPMAELPGDPTYVQSAEAKFKETYLPGAAFVCLWEKEVERVVSRRELQALISSRQRYLIYLFELYKSIVLTQPHATMDEGRQVGLYFKSTNPIFEHGHVPYPDWDSRQEVFTRTYISHGLGKSPGKVTDTEVFNYYVEVALETILTQSENQVTAIPYANIQEWQEALDIIESERKQLSKERNIASYSYVLWRKLVEDGNCALDFEDFKAAARPYVVEWLLSEENIYMDKSYRLINGLVNDRVVKRGALTPFDTEKGKYYYKLDLERV